MLSGYNYVTDDPFTHKFNYCSLYTYFSVAGYGLPQALDKDVKINDKSMLLLLETYGVVFCGSIVF